MIKNYVVQYNDDGLHSLAVIDPDGILENGNNQVVKLLIGAYADETLKILIEEDAEYAIE